MDDTCAVQVVIHMLDSRLEINVSRFLGTYQRCLPFFYSCLFHPIADQPPAAADQLAERSIAAPVNHRENGEDNQPENDAGDQKMQR